MTAAATQLKIGLFVVCAIVAVVIAAVVLRVEGRVPVVRYHTYFDESVSGLDIGSPVEFRGIRIGNVASIGVAPDHAHVDVGLDISELEVMRLALARLAPTLRARMQSSGITGVKYIDIEPATQPPPQLTFAPAAQYIPSRPSFFHQMELRAERVSDSVPVLLDRLVQVADHTDRVLGELERSKLPTRASAAFDEIDAMMRDVRRFVRSVDRAGLPEKLDGAIAHVEGAAANLHGVLAKLEGDGEIEQAMRAVGGAARAFRELVQEVEREPDMLIKGRSANRP